MISCSECKKATLPASDGGCIRTGGIVDIGCKYGEPRIITNADKLRAMSDEELAEWFNVMNGIDKVCPDFGAHNCRESCRECWLDWLRQEVSDAL